MTITKILTEDDFLTYLLYSASKNKRSKRNRLRSWLVISGAFLVLGYMFYDGNTFYSYYFLAAGVVSLIFYPFYQRYQYKKHYHKFVLDKLAYRIGKECFVDFGPEIIETKDVAGESKINTREVAEIVEISNHYFVILNSGDGLIIPKTVVNETNFIESLLKAFNRPDITVTRELNWKWR